MSDFQTSRINMVDSQIHTMGVVNEDILDAFRTVPREAFVPADKQGIAYCDEDMPIGKSRYLMEPVTHARLLQAAAPKSDDVVLDVGCGMGYSSAIFASLVSKVVAVEPDGALLSEAEQNWKKQGLDNIVPHCGSVAEGCATHGPYSLILLGASVAEIPPLLFDQLAPNGRLLAVVRPLDGDKIGRAVLLKKAASGAVGERILFDASVPYFPGYEPVKTFSF